MGCLKCTAAHYLHSAPTRPDLHHIPADHQQIHPVLLHDDGRSCASGVKTQETFESSFGARLSNQSMPGERELKTTTKNMHTQYIECQKLTYLIKISLWI